MCAALKQRLFSTIDIVARAIKRILEVTSSQNFGADSDVLSSCFLYDALATEGELSRAIDPRTIGPVHIYDR